MRTTPGKVRDTIVVPDTTDLTTVMTRANTVTDLVEAAGLSNTALLLEIETLLAAHYYSLKDPLYKSKQTGKSSGSFMDRDLWAEAKKLDPTGTLEGMEDNNGPVTLEWLGLKTHEQTDYQDRNLW